MSELKFRGAAVRRGGLYVLDGGSYGLFMRFPINPGEIKDTHPPNYAEHNIVGRSHPIAQWTHGSDRTISFKLNVDMRNEAFYVGRVDVVSRGNQGGVDPFETNDYRSMPYRKRGSNPHDKVVRMANFLRALTKPKASGIQGLVESETFSEPPKVLFVFGDFYRIRCIVKNVPITFTHWDTELRPLAFTCDVTLTEQPLYSVSFDEYLEKGDNRPYSAEDKELI